MTDPAAIPELRFGLVLWGAGMVGSLNREVPHYSRSSCTTGFAVYRSTAGIGAYFWLGVHLGWDLCHAWRSKEAEKIAPDDEE